MHNLTCISISIGISLRTISRLFPSAVGSLCAQSHMYFHQQWDLFVHNLTLFPSAVGSLCAQSHIISISSEVSWCTISYVFPSAVGSLCAQSHIFWWCAAPSSLSLSFSLSLFLSLSFSVYSFSVTYLPSISSVDPFLLLVLLSVGV